MHLLMKTLAAAALCVCSVHAEVPQQSHDLIVGKLFGAIGNSKPNPDKEAFSSLIKPLAFWALGTIKVDTFGHSERFANLTKIDYIPHGYQPHDDKLFKLEKDEHVINIVCGFDGGGMIYLSLTTDKTDKQNKPRGVSAGTVPHTVTDDMTENAPPGKELSGFVVQLTGENIVGASAIWTKQVE